MIVAGCAVLLAALIAPLAGLADATLATAARALDFGPLPGFTETPQRSTVLDRDGNVIAVLREENRKVVDLDEVPRHVVEAVIATEDERFRQHGGVSWRAVARAAIGNLGAGEITSGASTITQQLVKNTVVGVGDAETFARKLREAVYAAELERQLTKDAILERYLNEIYLGNGVYGVGTAAEFYWGKPVSELTLSDAAVLAGMIRSPAANDPLRHPDAARQRRDIVLSQMVAGGALHPDEATRAMRQPLAVDVQPLPRTRNPFWVSYVRSLLLQDPALGATAAEREGTLLRGGLTVRTTIDSRLQALADAVIAEVLTDVEGPQATLPVVDPQTGDILAVGFGPRTFGIGPGETQVNPALPGVGSGGRQSGSTFKAFGIVAALEAGVSPAYTMDTPSPYVAEHCQGAAGPYTVSNYSDGGGGIMDMAAATARSSNVYFVHLVDQLVSPEALSELAARMGITTPVGPYCSSVLGTAEVFAVDMASAFGTLANGGVHCRLRAVTEVLDARGRVISRQDPDCDRAVRSGVTARATTLLRGPIEDGTASRHGRIGRPAAGKTGTTDSYADAWFAGYIPQLSAAAWVGHLEELVPMTDPRCGEVTGGCLPTMIWAAFMRQAVEVLGLPAQSFPQPPPLPRGTVPDLVARSRAEAASALMEARFSWEVQVVRHHRPAGEVVAQQPSGGVRVEEGTTVVLRVSDGEAPIPTVPDLIGMSRADAEAAVRALGLQPRVGEVAVVDADWFGRVLSQSPEPGTAIDQPADEPDSAGLGEVVLRVGRERTAEDPEPPSPESPSPESSSPESPATPEPASSDGPQE